MAAIIHPDMQPLAFLLGTWKGTGEGRYPTIQPFTYGEEIVVESMGRPFFSYRQRTWHTQDNSPLHAECGYWRLTAKGTVELMLAHPTGITEVEEGTFSPTTIKFRTVGMTRSSTAKRVDALTRTFTFNGDELGYQVEMAAVEKPLQFHLKATLRRVPA